MMQSLDSPTSPVYTQLTPAQRVSANGDITDVKVPYDGQSTDNDNVLSNGKNS